MAVAPSSLSRLHELQAHSQRLRASGEAFIPGKGGAPGRWVAYGGMATCPSNNVPDIPPRAVVDTPLGPELFQRRRRRRADGTLRPWLVVPEGARRLEPPQEDRRAAARIDLEQALSSQTGHLVLAPTHRARWIKGRVTVIPHKGAVSRFFTIEDAADALALGLL